ncbi:MAG: NADH dehydrogenase (quinone) subunit D [Bdellovibrionales bacterium]|nr:NADH dehydrogenase (quinone) subunit D [Bdellovibrionales bacterium]
MKRVDRFEDGTDLFENSKMLINLGPQHPATHGTLRIACRLNGETVEDSECEIGYLHRAMEKLGEVKTYHKFIPYTDRLNYCSALQNNVAYVTTVEKLLGIEIPERNTYIRTMVCEMARIIDHLICVGINAFDLGAMTFFLYGFHQREQCYSLIESLCGSRLTTTYTRVGGLMADLPEGYLPKMKAWLDELEATLREMDKLLTGNRIWVDRTRGVGAMDARRAISYSMTGPCLRASNVNVDLRRDAPYLAYRDLEFDVPVAKGGDVYDRYLIRMREMFESIRILRQIVDRMPKGPIWADDKRVRIPDKERVHNSMEALIHHFKFFMEGFDVPEGEAYVPMEGPNGEVGFYIISRGGPKSYRMRIRSPSFFLFQPVDEMVKGENIADVIAVLGSVNIIAGELDR